MSNVLQTYLTYIRQKHATAIAREHTCRSLLEQLLRQLNSGLTISNDSARIACGAPEFILLRVGVPLGHIETKDITSDLDDATTGDRIQRYRHSLHNLFLISYPTNAPGELIVHQQTLGFARFSSFEWS